MEVVQGGALVCASRAPSSATHPPLRLAHHRLDADGPAAAALHVQTEEGGGGGGLEPSWWRISASGSWDGGERRMRYGKLIDDRPGVVPGAVQRRKLEMLETHAPGASMRVVHSQSTASWRQDGGDVTSMGMSSSGTSRSVVSSSSSSSTRVTSYRQWSSNFSQTSSGIAALQQDTRPTVTEFGNLELALNPLDVSFLRTRGNVGRSGSIGSRRPPTRTRRLSTDAPSPEAVEDNSDDGEERSPRTDFSSDEPTGSHDEKTDVSAVSPTVSDGIRGSMSRLLALGWSPAGAGTPIHTSPSPLRSHLHPSSMPLHRKRSVSSEDLRGADEGSDGVANHLEDGTGGENDGGRWERGTVVRRSLPSSEWRSVVGPSDGPYRLLRPRDPLKSSSVPALGGPSTSRKSSLVTAESLREMKGRLKHRGSSEMVMQTEIKSLANGGDSAMGNGVDDCNKMAEVSVSLRATKEDNGQDDRRKSWSVGCRNFGKREMVNGDEDSIAANRRRSYAFEYSADGEEGPVTSKKELGWNHLHGGSKGDTENRGVARSTDTHDFTQSRVNEMLKKWSAIGQNVEQDENSRKISASSPSLSPKFPTRGLDVGTPPARKSSTTWLEHGDSPRLENGLDLDLAEYLKPSTISGSRTTLRVTHSEGNSTFKDEIVGGISRSMDQEVVEDLPPSSSTHLVEDYSCPREMSPVDWAEGDPSCKSPTEVTKGDSTATTSAGISVTFSNADGGENHNNVRQRYSVTKLESKEGEVTRGDGAYKMRSSKKVEFSKTEVHFAAESGRFHIVETAGKPPPSNNFRRRRRSPTGSLNVDSNNASVVGGRLTLGGSIGGQSALSNGMRFGDSPYEKRLLAGTDAADMSSRPVFEGSPVNIRGFSDDDNHIEDGDLHLEYSSTSTRLFGEEDVEEVKEIKDVQGMIQEREQSNASPTFLHPCPEDLASEKPKGILRSNLLSLNSLPWKVPQKPLDDSIDDNKPKFGGVRLRPVVSPELHTRINLSSMEASDSPRSVLSEKSFSDSLSPGQMELQKLLKSLRPVSVASFPTDNSLDTQISPSTQVANGGGMEVRISSGIQSAVTNTVIIGNDSIDVHTPLSVAQRVREVEERRQRELACRLDSSPKSVGRAGGQYSTRVTLGPVSPTGVSMESQVLAKKTVHKPQNSAPPSPKPAAKMSTHSKIARIHNAQGDASGLAGDIQQRNPMDVKASAHMTENHTRNEHSQELSGVTCIAFGLQGVAKDGREHKEGTAVNEGVGTGVAGADSAGCKIFSALSVVRERESRRNAAKGEGLKPLEIREKSPEGQLHARHREYKSSSPSKYLSTGWSSGSLKSTKEENKGKADSVSKELRSQKKGKETALNVESLKKSHYAVVNSSPQESKIFSTGVDEIGKFSLSPKLVEKRMEGREEITQTKISKLEHSQRRTSVESTSSCEVKRDGEKTKKNAGKNEPRTVALGSPLTSRSSRLSEGMRLQHRHSVTTTVRPASPRQPPVSTELNSSGAGGSPSSSRAMQRKRVRRKGSGGGKEGPSGGDERRKGRKGSAGEEMSEESAILAELTRAADEILHAVNGYSDDLTSDEDAADAKGSSTARPKRRSTKAHSKRTSAATREAVKGVSSTGSVTEGAQKTRSSSGGGVVGATARGKDGVTRVSSKGKEPITKERPQVREGGVGQESPKVSGNGSRSHQRVSSPISTALPSGSSHSSGGAAVRVGNSSPLPSEKSPRLKLQQHQVGGSSSPRVKSAMMRIEPTNRVAEVKLIEKRPPLPPGGQRRGKEGLKERSEVHTRNVHSKVKTSTTMNSTANGDSEVSNSETKRTMNIARALEAVMPDARNKARKVERKTDETQRKEAHSFHPVSPQLSSGMSLSIERKKVASSREGDKTTRRGVHHSNNSPT